MCVCVCVCVCVCACVRACVHVCVCKEKINHVVLKSVVCIWIYKIKHFKKSFFLLYMILENLMFRFYKTNRGGVQQIRYVHLQQLLIYFDVLVCRDYNSVLVGLQWKSYFTWISIHRTSPPPPPHFSCGLFFLFSPLPTPPFHLYKVV